MTSTNTNQPSNVPTDTEVNRPALTEANLQALQESLATSTTNGPTVSNVSHRQQLVMSC